MAAVNSPDTPFENERDRHLFGSGPKRILSLDGGGVRGAVSIAFLERLEKTIEGIEGKPTALCDWFDLIGGTSTGAIIACALALGYRASDIHAFYNSFSQRVFRRSRWRVSGIWSKFDAGNLMKELTAIIGPRTLGTNDLRTGLAILTKRVDTGSSWIVTNNPRSKYWDTPPDGSFLGNRHYPLANLVRASTAAPYYFDPEKITIAPDSPPGLFVDGGLSPHNNPALYLWLVASLPQYGLLWSPGPDNLTIVSVGTGTHRSVTDGTGSWLARNFSLAVHALVTQVSDSQELALGLMSWLGDSPTKWLFNSELGDLGQVSAPGNNPLFRFLRYDIRLEQQWLHEELDVNLDKPAITKLCRMDAPENIPTLYELGVRAAERQDSREPFAPCPRKQFVERAAR